MVDEHDARYRWAAASVAGLRVLDVADHLREFSAGELYGMIEPHFSGSRGRANISIPRLAFGPPALACALRVGAAPSAIAADGDPVAGQRTHERPCERHDGPVAGRPDVLRPDRDRAEARVMVVRKPAAKEDRADGPCEQAKVEADRGVPRVERFTSNRSREGRLN